MSIEDKVAWGIIAKQAGEDLVQSMSDDTFNNVAEAYWTSFPLIQETTFFGSLKRAHREGNVEEWALGIIEEYREPKMVFLQVDHDRQLGWRTFGALLGFDRMAAIVLEDFYMAHDLYKKAQDHRTEARFVAEIRDALRRDDLVPWMERLSHYYETGDEVIHYPYTAFAVAADKRLFERYKQLSQDHKMVWEPLVEWMKQPENMLDISDETLQGVFELYHTLPTFVAERLLFKKVAKQIEAGTIDDYLPGKKEKFEKSAVVYEQLSPESEEIWKKFAKTMGVDILNSPQDMHKVEQAHQYVERTEYEREFLTQLEKVAAEGNVQKWAEHIIEYFKENATGGENYDRIFREVAAK